MPEYRPNPDQLDVAPGWYPDPTSADVVRWWDGTAWSSHTAPKVVPASASSWPAPTSPAVQLNTELRFDHPFTSDWIFWLALLSVAGGVIVNYSPDAGGLFDMVIAAAANALVFGVLPLAIRRSRRSRDVPARKGSAAVAAALCAVVLIGLTAAVVVRTQATQRRTYDLFKMPPTEPTYLDLQRVLPATSEVVSLVGADSSAVISPTPDGRNYSCPQESKRCADAGQSWFLTNTSYGSVHAWANVEWFRDPASADVEGYDQRPPFYGDDPEYLCKFASDPTNSVVGPYHASTVAAACAVPDDSPEYLSAFPEGSVGERLDTVVSSRPGEVCVAYSTALYGHAVITFSVEAQDCSHRYGTWTAQMVKLTIDRAQRQ